MSKIKALLVSRLGSSAIIEVSVGEKYITHNGERYTKTNAYGEDILATRFDYYGFYQAKILKLDSPTAKNIIAKMERNVKKDNIMKFLKSESCTDEALDAILREIELRS